MRTLLARFAIVVALTAAASAGATAADAATPSPTTCAAAWQDPHSSTATECRELGWTVRSRIVVTPHGVVRHSTLRSCAFEDASSGPVPCSWNLRTTDGNGRGLAYYATGTHQRPRFHYVWSSSPTGDGWRWVGPRLARALAARDGATSRDWQACIVHDGDPNRVRCADGHRARY